MFNNTIASKRCIKPGICYRRKMQSCEFSLIIILFIFLHVFSILIRFLKKIVWQYMLMAQSNKNFLTSCFYWFLWSSYLYHIWLFRDWYILVILKKIRVLGRTPLKRPLLATGTYIVAHNFTKVALLKAYLSVQRFNIFDLTILPMTREEALPFITKIFYLWN